MSYSNWQGEMSRRGNVRAGRGPAGECPTPDPATACGITASQFSQYRPNMFAWVHNVLDPCNNFTD